MQTAVADSPRKRDGLAALDTRAELVRRCLLMEEGVDAGEQMVGKEGLDPEGDVEAGVLLFGLIEAADDEDGKVRVLLAELGDEAGAAHAGHDVVRDDEVDVVRILAAGELFERALGAEDGDDRVACSLEDGLPGCGLDCVVVDQEYRRCHRCHGSRVLFR